MTVTQIDPMIREQLRGATGRVRLQGEGGQTIGYFQPVEPIPASVREWSQQQSTAESIERARRSAARVTTSDVLESLHRQS